MRRIIPLAVAIACALPALAIDELPDAFKTAAECPAECDCTNCECDDCQCDQKTDAGPIRSLEDLERRVELLEQTQITEDRVREICRDEISVAMAIRTPTGQIRTTQSTPLTCTDCPAESQYGITLAPGERLISIDGVPVSQAAVPIAAASVPAGRRIVSTYSTPEYSVQVQQSGAAIVRQRRPVRRIAKGTAIVVGRAAKGAAIVGGRIAKGAVVGAGKVIAAPFRCAGGR